MMSYNKPEGAHFNQAKWSASTMALCFAMLVSSLVASVALANRGVGSRAESYAAVGGLGGFSEASAFASGRGSKASSIAQVVGPRPPIAPAAPLKTLLAPPAPVQDTSVAQAELSKQLEALLNELVEIEGQERETLDQCKRWYDLERSYLELVGKSAEARQSEIQKKQDCDDLFRFFDQTRGQLAAFRSSAHDNQAAYIAYVMAVVQDYLRMKQALALNEQLANEFEDLAKSDEAVLKLYEQLEDFLGHMRTALQPEPEDEEAAPSEQAAQVAPLEEADKAAALWAELRQLDNTLKDIIDREGSLSDDDLAQLANLGGTLDEHLAKGVVPPKSGRFHYLQGTLNGVRAVIVRKMVESGIKARAAEEAAKKAAEEEAAKKAAEEEAAKQAAEEEAARKAAEEEAARKAAEEEAAKKAAEEEAARKAAEEEAARQAAEEEAAKKAAEEEAAKKAAEEEAAKKAAEEEAAKKAAKPDVKRKIQKLIRPPLGAHSAAAVESMGNLAFSSAYSQMHGAGSAASYASAF